MWSQNIFIIFLIIRRISSCQIINQIAFCQSQSLNWVPYLPSNVVAVDLSLNYIMEVNDTSFLHLELLQNLDLGMQKTQFLRIKKNAFRNLSNLVFLHLGSNRNLVLDPDAFVGLFNLKRLNLIYNGLSASILEDEYLRPLVSLEVIYLNSNVIERVQPNLFFRNLTNLKEVVLKLNKIKTICENDLLGFRGKFFSLFDLSSNHLEHMNAIDFDWKTCGNPFKNVSLEVLDLSLNSLNADRTRLLFRALGGTIIHHVILSQNIMGRSFGYNKNKDPNNETFEGLKNSSVRSLKLSRNFIFSLEPFVFAPFKELKEITLSVNKINQIKKDAFSGLQNLKSLNLSNNLIGEVFSYTFEGLHSVTEIDLSNNHIGVIQHNSFTGLFSLQTLNLRGNAIKNLHEFAPIPKLENVLLGDNKIQSSYGLSTFAQNSIFVDLSENRLRDLGVFYDLMNFPNVQFILLRHNKLSDCASNSVVPKENNLLYLDLEDNMLQLIWEKNICLDMFDNLNKLNRLRLNQNFLQFLPEAIFKGLITLNSLDLSLNLLTHLPNNVFPESLKVLNLSGNILGSPNPDLFSSLSLIDLGRNPYVCDCNLKEYLLWISQTNVTFFSHVEDMVCYFPNELLGVRLLDLNTESCVEEDQRLILKLRLSAFISSVTIIILIMMSTITFIHFRGLCFVIYKKIITSVQGSPSVAFRDSYKYDAYLCFSSSDFKWVKTALLKRLDAQFSEKNLFRFCLEVRDFIPGEDRITNIRNAIWCSKKTVCIVTKEFLKDGWCIEAFNMAQTRLFTELQDVLIMVVVGGLPQFKLMKCDPIRTFIKSRHCLHWPEDFQDIDWFYEKLAQNILKEEKSKKQTDVLLQNIGVQS
ncbi:toll-like receptor 5 isoform X1 [Lepisosteus oculatus]|nr:PREDICTED: toll-like receptor 5 isoform X1 [Lepisosteus oculatus]